MVATDVASRGIGMIETPLPFAATPSRLYNSALLSTLRRFLDCVLLSGLYRVFRVFRFSNFRVSWIF
jgi:ATP-dependent RNA helicase DDX5/DBP2